MHSMLDLELATMLHRERLDLAQVRRTARTARAPRPVRLSGLRALLPALHLGRRQPASAPAPRAAVVEGCGPMGCAA